MAQMKTPGVYIIEKNAFPNSVVEVATAIPAFIGHTQFARDGNKDLTGIPFRISSMAEFHSFFGFAPTLRFGIRPEDSESEDTTNDINVLFPDGSCQLTLPKTFYALYYNMLLFYANGGGPCYIVSVGDYEHDFKSIDFTNALLALKKEQEPTLVVVPEAVYMEEGDCYKVQTAALMHCGNDMKNRFAILDVFNGYKDENGAVIKSFRENIGSNFLAYCASYYPWINTSIVTEKDNTFYNIEKDSLEKLEELILNEFSKKSGVTNEAVNELMDKFKLLLTMKEDEAERFHTLLYQVSSVYRSILREIRLRINLLPPSASMAGLYTMVDNTRGVWKAPANISINNVVTPALSITNAEQEDLNVPMNGKAVNAIRSFPGEGIKVWGARTMDGNSLDWRYINVRRTMIFLEESIKNAARAYVFEPNVANTWVNMRSMIDGFLRGVWKRGGLAGTSPEDAYSIHIGLGDTMTPEDILEGILRISVFVAITRPAEFIEITFQQQMQKS